MDGVFRAILIDSLVNETIEAVRDFLTTIRYIRKMVIDSLWEIIDAAAIDEALKETIITIERSVKVRLRESNTS